MVLALAVRHVVSLVIHYRRLEAREGVAFGRDLALRGASERLGAILMSAAVTAAFLLPLAFAGQRAGTEILQPMALVTLGGLITATILNLFVLPALFLRFGSSPTPERIANMAEEGVPAA